MALLAKNSQKSNNKKKKKKKSYLNLIMYARIVRDLAIGETN